MSRKTLSVMGVLAAMLVTSLTVGGLDAASSVELSFGFGGSMSLALFPNLEGINAFLSENGIDPFGGILFGGGGSGRGGTIGGWSVGGMGWGAVASSKSGDRQADLAIGGGGFDLGLALGGDENSVLTVGTVLGGGATMLMLTFEEQENPDVTPQGVAVEPAERILGRGFGFVLPYVSLEAQIVPWMGLEVRIGYVIPLVGFDFGDLIGVPTPSLDLSGPFVGISFLFGGIGRADEAGRAVRGWGRGVEATSSGTFDLGEKPGLSIDNRAGGIVVTSYAVDTTQTGSRSVEWEAVRRARSPHELAELAVSVVETSEKTTLRTSGRGTVVYTIRVPGGTNLDIVQGAGTVQIGSHTATVVGVTLGAGDVVMFGVHAPETQVSVGAGTVTLSGVEAELLNAHVGVGRIEVDAPRDVSATVSASVGLGDAMIADFPGMATIEQGVFGRTIDALLGSGTARFSLSAGIGTIEVRPILP